MYHVILVLGVQKRDSVIIYMHIRFRIIFRHR